ncbi:hypothetical protein AAVH_42781, partial [Aphelenchoides avenae]
MRRRRASSFLGRPAASKPPRANREPAPQPSDDGRLKRTVVLSNLRESDHTEWRVRKDADEKAVGKLLSTLGLQLAVNKTLRVGGVQNKDGSERTRPRSLFVEMQSVRAAKKVLHRKHLLGKTGEGDPNACLRGVYIDRPKEATLSSKQAKCARKARRRAMQLKNEMSTEELLEWLAKIPPSDFRLPKDLPVTCDEGQLQHELFLECRGPDVVVIVESWLKQEVPDSVLVHKLPYTVYRRDRGSNGGGLVIVVKDCIPSARVRFA